MYAASLSASEIKIRRNFTFWRAVHFLMYSQLFIWRLDQRFCFSDVIIRVLHICTFIQ